MGGCDALVVDEAAQAAEAETLIALQASASSSITSKLSRNTSMISLPPPPHPYALTRAPTTGCLAGLLRVCTPSANTIRLCYTTTQHSKTKHNNSNSNSTAAHSTTPPHTYTQTQTQTHTNHRPQTCPQRLLLVGDPLQLPALVQVS